VPPDYADLSIIHPQADRESLDELILSNPLDSDSPPKGLEESEVIAILDSWEASAISTRMDDVSRERARAIEYYNQEPYGNEQKNWSKFVSSETFDTVEWLKTELLKIFTSSASIVEFLPESEEDIESAKQKTQYCNYIFFRRNNGFEILLNLLHDALLQKNSIVKIYAEKLRPEPEKYRGLTEEQVTLLSAQGDVMSVSPSSDGFFEVEVLPADPGYDIVIEVIPPEDFYVNSDHKSISVADADFVQHRSRMSLSALRERGIIGLDDEPEGDASEDDWNDEELARDEDLSDFYRYTQPLDPAMKRVVVKDSSVRIDFDEDGIAERRRIIRIGSKVYLNERIKHIGYACFSPMPQPHRWLGKSEADLTMSLQLISSELQRQLLNNIYLSNHQRPIVLEGASGPLVNLESLMSAGPGEPIFERSAGALRFEQPGFIASDLLAVKGELREQLQNRTGVLGQKVDADVIARTASGGAVASVIAAETGDSRVQGIARIFAEITLKEIFKIVVQIARDHQNPPQEFRLGNKFISVDPREWSSMADTITNVGLGSGASGRNAASMKEIIDQQHLAVQAGGFGTLVTAKNIYNSVSMYAELIGFRDPSLFWTDPDTVEQAPEGPSEQDKLIAAQMEVERLKAEIRAAEIHKDLIVAEMANKNDLEIAALKANTEIGLKIGSSLPLPGRLPGGQTGILSPPTVPAGEPKGEQTGKRPGRPRRIKGKIGGKDFDVKIEGEP